MSLSPREYIYHILDEIDFVLSVVPGTDFESFSDDETLLIHDYFGVDYTIVWDVATTKLPQLRQDLQRLLALTRDQRL